MSVIQGLTISSLHKEYFASSPAVSGTVNSCGHDPRLGGVIQSTRLKVKGANYRNQDRGHMNNRKNNRSRHCHIWTIRCFILFNQEVYFSQGIYKIEHNNQLRQYVYPQNQIFQFIMSTFIVILSLNQQEMENVWAWRGFFISVEEHMTCISLPSACLLPQNKSASVKYFINERKYSYGDFIL